MDPKNQMTLQGEGHGSGTTENILWQLAKTLQGPCSGISVTALIHLNKQVPKSFLLPL